MIKNILISLNLLYNNKIIFKNIINNCWDNSIINYKPSLTCMYNDNKFILYNTNNKDTCYISENTYINKNDFLNCVYNNIKQIKPELEINSDIIINNNCNDYNIFCNQWSIIGECEKNKKYMLTYCQKSCKVC